MSNNVAGLWRALESANKRIGDLQQDAARYRHMVEHLAEFGVPFDLPTRYGIEFPPLHLTEKVEPIEFWMRRPTKAEIDAAIDAAIQGEAQEVARQE